MNPSDSQESLNSSSSFDSSELGESLKLKRVLPRQDASDSPIPLTRTLSADSFFAPKKELDTGEKKSFDEKLLMLRNKTSASRALLLKIQFVNGDEYAALLGEKYVEKDADDEVFLEKIEQIKNKLSQKKQYIQEDCVAAVLDNAKVSGDAEQREEFLLYFSDISEQKEEEGEYPRSIRFDIEKDRELLNEMFFSKKEMKKMADIEGPEWLVRRDCFYCVVGNKEEYCEKFAMIFDLFQNYEQSHEILEDIKESKYFNPKSSSMVEFERLDDFFKEEVMRDLPSTRPKSVYHSETVRLPNGALETSI